MCADSKPQAAPERGLRVALEIVEAFLALLVLQTVKKWRYSPAQERQIQNPGPGPLTCILSFKYRAPALRGHSRYPGCDSQMDMLCSKSITVWELSALSQEVPGHTIPLMVPGSGRGWYAPKVWAGRWAGPVDCSFLKPHHPALSSLRPAPLPPCLRISLLHIDLST